MGFNSGFKGLRISGVYIHNLMHLHGCVRTFFTFIARVCLLMYCKLQEMWDEMSNILWWQWSKFYCHFMRSGELLVEIDTHPSYRNNDIVIEVRVECSSWNYIRSTQMLHIALYYLTTKCFLQKLQGFDQQHWAHVHEKYVHSTLSM